jgi:GNAT superfamily N-acetyltransferase
MPIRPAVDTDVFEIRRCVVDAFSVYADRMDRPPAPMLDDYAAKVREGVVYVDVEGSIRGVAVLIARADHLFLETLAVAPGFQGQGVGSRLLAFAESRALDLALPEVRLDTNERMTENLRFYAECGYRETGRGSQDGYDRVFLCKSLVP